MKEMIKNFYSTKQAKQNEKKLQRISIQYL